MQDILALTNMIIDTLKHLKFYGISMWFVLQTIIWFTLVVWPLTMFLLNRLSGGDE
jgi:hypothetical protein